MSNGIAEAADSFEGLMDESGLMPGDEGFVEDQLEEGSPESDVAEAFEEELEDGDEVQDEPEDEEADEGDEAEGDESDSDEDVEEDEASQLFDVTIDGEEYEVNLPELRAGYLRNEDFVKRTTALEERISQREAELAQKEAELVKEIEATAVISTADLRAYDNIDWNKLKAEDPAAYQTKRLEFIDRRDEIQRQLTRRSQIQSMQNKAEEIKHQAYLNSQFELVKKLIPEFTDESYKSKILAYAESVGFTAEDIMGISDAKQLLMLDQARKFSEGQLRKKAVIAKKVKQELPEVVRPSGKTRVVSEGSKRLKAQADTFKQTGTIRDAAALFEHFV